MPQDGSLEAVIRVFHPGPSLQLLPSCRQSITVAKGVYSTSFILEKFLCFFWTLSLSTSLPSCFCSVPLQCQVFLFRNVFICWSCLTSLQRIAEPKILQILSHLCFTFPFAFGHPWCCLHLWLSFCLLHPGGLCCGLHFFLAPFFLNLGMWHSPEDTSGLLSFFFGGLCLVFIAARGLSSAVHGLSSCNTVATVAL